MAYPTPVNGQITDSITQSNVQVLGSSPATALGMLMEMVASSMGIASQNAVANQQNVNNISTAVITKCVNKLIGE